MIKKLALSTKTNQYQYYLLINILTLINKNIIIHLICTLLSYRIYF